MADEKNNEGCGGTIERQTVLSSLITDYEWALEVQGRMGSDISHTHLRAEYKAGCTLNNSSLLSVKRHMTHILHVNCGWMSVVDSYKGELPAVLLAILGRFWHPFGPKSLPYISSLVSLFPDLPFVLTVPPLYHLIHFPLFKCPSFLVFFFICVCVQFLLFVSSLVGSCSWDGVCKWCACSRFM